MLVTCESCLLCDAHHVVPEGASHLRLGPLAEMEAVSAEEGAVSSAVLWKR